jgi:uroporphyrinogen-III synthase
MFFSPSAVEAYSSNNKFDNEVVYSCIGNTTAVAVKEINEKAKLLISPAPSAEIMLEQIAIHFNLKMGTPLI